MSSLRETCCCGAEMEVTDRASDTIGLRYRGDEFRLAHAVCRERRHVAPAPVPRLTVTRHCGCADNPCSCMSSGGSIRDESQRPDALVAEESSSLPSSAESAD